MKKSQAIHIIIIASAIGAVLFLFIMLTAANDLLSSLFGSVEENVKKNNAVKAAQSGVESYFYDKYGEYPEITDIKPVWERYGYIIPDKRCFSGYVKLKEKNCMIYYYSKTDSFYDSKQYDEICSAMTENYFTDETLGSDVYADIDMIYSSYWTYRDNEAAKCTDVYFDGDIDKFIESLPGDYNLSADIFFSGNTETGRAYRELISDKLDELAAKFPRGSFSISIKNPEKNFIYPADLIESHSYTDLHADYGTLIAKGIRRKNSSKQVFYTEWCRIDEYVSMADIISETQSESSNFVFRTDSSYDGEAIFTNASKSNSYTLEGDAYSFQNRNSQHIFIRLDRRKFSIDDGNVPIILKRENNGNDLYSYFIGISPAGEPELRPMGNSWYLYDEEYIYIYVYSDEAVIMFTRLLQNEK